VPTDGVEASVGKYVGLGLGGGVETLGLLEGACVVGFSVGLNVGTGVGAMVGTFETDGKLDGCADGEELISFSKILYNLISNGSPLKPFWT